MHHNFLNTIKQATAGLKSPLLPYLLLSGFRHSTIGRQPRFTAWLCLGVSMPSTSSIHLRLLYNSCRVALDRSGGPRTEVGADLGL